MYVLTMKTAQTTQAQTTQTQTAQTTRVRVRRWVRARTRQFACAGAAFVFAACSTGRSPYTIGAAGPWQLAEGRSTRLGIALAVNEINDAGGIDGHPLAVREADDEADGVKAATIARTFVDDAAVSAVVGHVTSEAMVAAARVYDGHLSAVATAASSSDLTDLTRWTFRVVASDSVNGLESARYASRLGRRRVAILYENTSYGRGLADAFRRGFVGEIVTFDPIAADTPYAELFAAYVRARQPDLVFVAGAAASGLALITEARRQRVQADFMGGEGWSALALHPEVTEGVYVATAFTPTDPSADARKFVAAFRAANAGTAPDAHAALAYDATRVVAAALAAVGPNRERVREWLALFDSPVAGATGPIQFLRSGDPASRRMTMTRVRADSTLGVAGSAP